MTVAGRRVAGENSLLHCSLKKIESERETLPASHQKPIEHSYENPNRLFTLAKHPGFNLSRSNSGEQRAGAGDGGWHVSFRKSRPRFAQYESGQRPHAKETRRSWRMSPRAWHASNRPKSRSNPFRTRRSDGKKNRWLHARHVD